MPASTDDPRKFCARELNFWNFGGEMKEKASETLLKVRQIVGKTGHWEAAQVLFDRVSAVLRA